MVSPFWERSHHADRRVFLAGRANILRAVREWFWAHGFIEVEPTALTLSPGAEVHVDAFEVNEHYLHTSPEFAMKKLLAAGEERIFFLGKTWRRGEHGPLHAPEFTMIEWYRAHAAYDEIMDDCIELVRIAARAAGADALRWKAQTCDPFASPQKLTVREAFARHLPAPLRGGAGGGGDGDVIASTAQHPPPHPSHARGEEDANSAPHDAFSRDIVRIEPHLGSPALTLLTEYPISEAALARRCAHDASVAERFELYACGVELANGFGELTDPVEQRARLFAAMDEKEKRYGKRWPIDEDFLAALAHMPPSSGVALGFDRLVMLATHARRINDVLWTPE
jgi:lysyl-tRNA synthetase class 2